ncbi:glycosyl transferase [Rhizobium leguminosarum bv. trifolii WSM2297]|uniref:N-acetylglucosaminyltransferase n=1 Tax=Rhizobium leguminosarum bv. trifolii WSM2297 TaxID=754762 RepID=J0W6H2_RHILT|nr:chitooligosaccharide synthase NodC [Rhizobium leguminosarum]EJC80743.1 glycosyl transferase [Rhizobium leguminosarum bv. trifolii WSM2297]
MTLLETTSIAAVSLYALVSSTYRIVQVLHARRSLKSGTAEYSVEESSFPSVDIIVPSFNESPRVLSECLGSLANQDYPGALRVYVVDDGSRNRDAVVAEQIAYAGDARFEFIILPRNVGKRKAQIAAISRSSGDLILNVDSDTTLASDVVSKLSQKMRDPAVGAVMGQLTASNRRDTWLTRLIDMEYWLACNEERAAQDRFGAVMCCCGPCAMYRRAAFHLLLDQYETQLYRGKPSDFGEDRHLTILMLSAGFRTEYEPSAIAATVVPDGLRAYLRQQLRWARSTFRDTQLGLHLLRGMNWYLTLDVVGQNAGPLLLEVSALAGIAQFALTGSVPWWTIGTIGSFSLIRCGVAAYRARQLRFLGFSLHTLLLVFLLLPLKAYALCTLSNSDWLSRGSGVKAAGGVRKQKASEAPRLAAPDATFSGE